MIEIRRPTGLEWEERRTVFLLGFWLAAAFLLGLFTDYGIQKRSASEDTERLPAGVAAPTDVRGIEHPNLEGLNQ